MSRVGDVFEIRDGTEGVGDIARVVLVILLLLMTVVAVVAITGRAADRWWQAELVKRGHAEYLTRTGEWQWKTVIEDAKK